MNYTPNEILKVGNDNNKKEAIHSHFREALGAHLHLPFFTVSLVDYKTSIKFYLCCCEAQSTSYSLSSMLLSFIAFLLVPLIQ